MTVNTIVWFQLYSTNGIRYSSVRRVQQSLCLLLAMKS